MGDQEQEYNPSAYSQSAHFINSNLRNWSFNEKEDRPVAYLVTPDNYSNNRNGLDRGLRNSNNGVTDDSALRNFLRNARGPMTPHSSKYRQKQNNAWEKYSKEAWALGVNAGDFFAANGVHGERGSFHKKVRGHNNIKKEEEEVEVGVVR